ncbi:hypothetical protein BDZ91DRAFT_764742 [Kalaharituber pfeilii]|nr:hypothetical protein BDZ91DRAFT_764742 [Kalaharituber pfeilii]
MSNSDLHPSEITPLLPPNSPRSAIITDPPFYPTTPTRYTYHPTPPLHYPSPRSPIDRSYTATPIRSSRASWVSEEDYRSSNQGGEVGGHEGCLGRFIGFLLAPWRALVDCCTWCCACECCLCSCCDYGVGNPGDRGRRPNSAGSYTASESSFRDYAPSQDYSATGSPRGAQTPTSESAGMQLGGGVYDPGLYSAGYSPSSPYSPYSGGPGMPPVPGQQADYFSPRGSQRHGQYHHYQHYRDVEAELRPGYTSHFLPGSYTRTATNTQPTTRQNTNSVPSPPDEEPQGMVAYGHGYDAARQTLIYRRILAMDAELAGGSATAMVDRGYEGGDEDTGTGTTNSGFVSESVSGRTSPYEERRAAGRGRPRAGNSWWGMGMGMGLGLGLGRGREIVQPEEYGNNRYGNNAPNTGTDDEDDRPLLARRGWSGEQIPQHPGRIIIITIILPPLRCKRIHHTLRAFHRLLSSKDSPPHHQRSRQFSSPNPESGANSGLANGGNTSESDIQPLPPAEDETEEDIQFPAEPPIVRLSAPATNDHDDSSHNQNRMNVAPEINLLTFFMWLNKRRKTVKLTAKWQLIQYQSGDRTWAPLPSTEDYAMANNGIKKFEHLLMHQRGIEPRSNRWQRFIIPLDH